MYTNILIYNTLHVDMVGLISPTFASIITFLVQQTSVGVVFHFVLCLPFSLIFRKTIKLFFPLAQCFHSTPPFQSSSFSFTSYIFIYYAFLLKTEHPYLNCLYDGTAIASSLTTISFFLYSSKRRKISFFLY